MHLGGRSSTSSAVRGFSQWPSSHWPFSQPVFLSPRAAADPRVVLSSLHQGSRHMLHKCLKVLFVLAIGVAVPAWAQDAVVRGSIRSDRDEPVPVVGVQIPELQLQVLSGANGLYTIPIPAARVHGQPITVRVRSIGYKPQSKSPFAVTRIDMTATPTAASDPLRALQGKLGANIVSGTGRPGTQASVMLRGPTSLNASGRSQDPLYIVDGVIINGNLPEIAQQDIESIEVVKGAAGASLYGA